MRTISWITVAVLIGNWEATGENKIALCVWTNTKHKSFNATADTQKDANIIAEVCSVLKGKRPSEHKLSLSIDVSNTLVLCLTDLAKCLKLVFGKCVCPIG